MTSKTHENADKDKVSAEIAEYQRTVAGLFDAGSDAIIDNGGEGHAKVWYRELFRNAANEVLIFCKKLGKEAFGDSDIAREIENAQERGVKISILTQEPYEKIDEKKLAQSLGAKFSSAWKHEDFNFCVVDKRAFRFETDTENFKAYASACQPTIAGRLKNLFEEEFGRAEALVIS